MLNPVLLDKSGIVSFDYKGYLLYTTEDGFVRMRNDSTTLFKDKCKKDIKIYPKGNNIFTTVDPALGLRVWSDRNLVYTYQHNDMYNHDISPSGLVACTSDFTIRIFDLKQRYSFTNYKFKDSTKCLWKDDYVFYAINSDSIAKFDMRNDKYESYVFLGIKDFVLSDSAIYFIQQKAKTKYLIKCKEDISMNFTSQKVCGSKLCKINGKYEIAVGGRNEIEFINSECMSINIENVCLIKCMISNENECYLGTDNGLIRFNTIK